MLGAAAAIKIAKALFMGIPKKVTISRCHLSSQVSTEVAASRSTWLLLRVSLGCARPAPPPCSGATIAFRRLSLDSQHLDQTM
jgi:hypothetical protein